MIAWMSSLNQATLNWFQTIEQQHLNALLEQHFGYYLLLLGEANPSRVVTSPIQYHFAANNEVSLGVDMLANWQQLPIESHSLDMLVLSHVIEQTVAIEAVFSEAQRVLRHDGRLIITAFNPIRPLAKRLGKWAYPDKWAGTLLLPAEVKQRLQALNFEVESMISYGFCSRSHSVADSRSERWGEYFLPWLGIGYMLLLQKKTKSITPLKPAWKEAKILAGEPVLGSSMNNKEQ